MHRRFSIAAALVVAAMLSPLCLPRAAAQDVQAGKRKAVACQTCHGLDGIARLPDAPNLAGQPQPYLVRELTAYRSGARKNEMMSVAAKTLSDADIRDLAAYYSAIQIEVKSVPQ